MTVTMPKPSIMFAGVVPSGYKCWMFIAGPFFNGRYNYHDTGTCEIPAKHARSPRHSTHSKQASNGRLDSGPRHQRTCALDQQTRGHLNCVRGFACHMFIHAYWPASIVINSFNRRPLGGQDKTFENLYYMRILVKGKLQGTWKAGLHRWGGEGSIHFEMKVSKVRCSIFEKQASKQVNSLPPMKTSDSANHGAWRASVDRVQIQAPVTSLHKMPGNWPASSVPRRSKPVHENKGRSSSTQVLVFFNASCFGRKVPFKYTFCTTLPSTLHNSAPSYPTSHHMTFINAQNAIRMWRHTL